MKTSKKAARVLAWWVGLTVAQQTAKDGTVLSLTQCQQTGALVMKISTTQSNTYEGDKTLPTLIKDLTDLGIVVPEDLSMDIGAGNCDKPWYKKLSMPKVTLVEVVGLVAVGAVVYAVADHFFGDAAGEAMATAAEAAAEAVETAGEVATAIAG